MPSLLPISSILWKIRKVASQRKIQTMPTMNSGPSHPQIPKPKSLHSPLSSLSRRRWYAATPTLHFLPTLPMRNMIAGLLCCVKALTCVLVLSHPLKKMTCFEHISWSLSTFWSFERQRGWFTIQHQSMSSFPFFHLARVSCLAKPWWKLLSTPMFKI